MRYYNMQIDMLGFLAPIVVVSLQLVVLIYITRLKRTVVNLLTRLQYILPDLPKQKTMPTSLDRSRKRQADRQAQVTEAHKSLTTQGTAVDK